MKKAGTIPVILFTLTLICLGQDDLATIMERRQAADAQNKALDDWVRATERQSDRRTGLPPRRNSLTKAEKVRLAPSAEDLATYSQFLKKRKTGIVKLLNTSHCDNRVVNVDDPRCLEAPQIIGMGALYSFRAKSYLDIRSIDVSLANNRFSGWHPLSYSLFSELGDVAIDGPELQNGFRLPEKFAQTADVSRIIALKKQFEAGIEISGRRFSSSAEAKPNTGYLLYSGRYHRSGASAEVVVVFRVIRKEVDGSVVLIWRQL